MAEEQLIAILADTHGKLSENAIQTLQGVSLIIHAGDLDNEKVLKLLEDIAPVKAVRGNMDRGDWANPLPPTLVVQVQQTYLYVLHNLEDLDLNPKAAGFQAVIYGHSHQPEVRDRRGVWFINPGSASDPRGKFPSSLALMRIQDDQIQTELVNLSL